MLPNTDIGASVQKIDLSKVKDSINTLEIANTKFLCGYVQPNSNSYGESFKGEQDFNKTKWKLIQSE